MTKLTPEETKAYMDQHYKNWRSWGSWFSWGSPVGLSIFLLSLAAAIWIVAQVL